MWIFIEFLIWIVEKNREGKKLIIETIKPRGIHLFFQSRILWVDWNQCTFWICTIYSVLVRLDWKEIQIYFQGTT